LTKPVYSIFHEPPKFQQFLPVICRLSNPALSFYIYIIDGIIRRILPAVYTNNNHFNPINKSALDKSTIILVFNYSYANFV